MADVKPYCSYKIKAATENLDLRTEKDSHTEQGFIPGQHLRRPHSVVRRLFPKSPGQTPDPVVSCNNHCGAPDSLQRNHIKPEITELLCIPKDTGNWARF
ncbi:hypothetical protein Bbelb_146120 [Branchiostoma belcheri]|nr:hypothetical protein Bbelb_146120 [Branchiostoma belcheri]